MSTEPPLALVRRRDGPDFVAGDADHLRQGRAGRARVDGEAEGIARLFADGGEGGLAGAALLCPGADHLGHLIIWAIEDGAAAKALLNRPCYHPILEEGLTSALRKIRIQPGGAAPGMPDEGAPSGA